MLTSKTTMSWSRSVQLFSSCSMLDATIGYMAIMQLRPVHPAQFDDQMHVRFRRIVRDRGYPQHLSACLDDRDCGPGLVCQSNIYGKFCTLNLRVDQAS